jgi:uncharacterized membrane protein YgcG
LNCGSYGSGPTFQNGTTLWIGVDNTYGSYFNGSIDEFMFFQNTSLTAQQVLDIYNNQSPRFNSSGQQNFGNQSVFSISPGDTEVTVTGQVLNYSNSSVNLSIGYYNGSWFNATPQVFIGNNTFTIDAQSTNLTLNFTFYAGNSSAVSFLGGHNFYSPILSSVTKNLIIYLNDSANPSVSITSPTNKTNSSNTGLDVNFTVSDTSLQACWYSNDTYSVNRSLVCTGANSNLTNITWSQGNHNVTIYANDSYNNQNKSTVSFSIDSIAPDINITSPINKTESTDTGLDILYTRSDINLESCWYSNDSYSVNTTLASCGNLTTITWVVGLHNVTIYVNDSHGNQNRSSVTFNITSSGGSGGSSGGGGGGGSGGTSSSPNTKSSDNKIPENDNKKEEIIKQPEIPKEFICGEWEKCNVNYELNNIDSSILRGEQTRKCTDGETERIDRRECSYSQEISIKKFYEEGEEKKLHILDLKNDPIADIDIIEKIDKDGNLVEKLNLKFYV